MSKRYSDIVKVSSNSPATQVAGAIAAKIRECNKAEIHAIGAAAVNQAAKAIAIADSYLHEDGIEICTQFNFKDTEIEGQERSALVFRVCKRA